MVPLYVTTLYEHLGSLTYLCTKNETMALLYITTLTAYRELPKYELKDILIVDTLHSTHNT